MTDAGQAEDPRLSVEVGGQSLARNIEQAIARGDIVRRTDGGLELRNAADPDDQVGRTRGYLSRRGLMGRQCRFLNNFLFDHVYAKSAVPFGCRDCYKIMIPTRSLRAMMAMRQIAEATPFTTKSGAEVGNATNPHVFATYLYFDSLDQARQAYAELRESVDAHPALGPQVQLTIKRGCSNYERRCGPSDQYAFDPRLEAAEALLAERFVNNVPAPATSKEAVVALRTLRLVEVAYRIGDETYKDFTGGKPLYEPLVSYSPTPDDGPASEKGAAT
jgi:hypothetical protein